jgi:hypothetical protein
MSVAPDPLFLKAAERNAPIAALAIGKQVKAGGQDLLKEFGAVSASCGVSLLFPCGFTSQLPFGHGKIRRWDRSPAR